MNEGSTLGDLEGGGVDEELRVLEFLGIMEMLLRVGSDVDTAVGGR